MEILRVTFVGKTFDNSKGCRSKMGKIDRIPEGGVLQLRDN